MADVINERGACPSASGMSRIFHCPASFKLNLSELPETSESAEEGTLLHRVCELEVRLDRGEDNLNEEYQKLCKSLSEEQKGAIAFATKSSANATDYLEGGFSLCLEERLWAKSKLFSGKGDFLAISKNKAVIIDYKFGRGDVERAESNLQLASLAVLVADNYNGIDTVKVVIIQPRALDKSKRTTEAVFDLDAINDAREQINAKCEEALQAETPTQACGYWCAYCPSAYRCKTNNIEVNRQMQLATSPAGNPLTPANVRREFEICEIVEKAVKARKEKIKDYLERNPDILETCGLTLKQGASRAKIGDANEVFNALRAVVDISADEFVKCCTVGMTDLKALYHSKRKDLEKQTLKKSDGELKSLLEDRGLITYTTTAPSIQLIK